MLQFEVAFERPNLSLIKGILNIEHQEGEQGREIFLAPAQLPLADMSKVFLYEVSIAVHYCYYFSLVTSVATISHTERSFPSIPTKRVHLMRPLTSIGSPTVKSTQIFFPS